LIVNPIFLIFVSYRTKWRGDDNTLIDRFDARSHLDFLVEYNDPSGEEPLEALDNEERMLNYERYRTLVQNEAVGSKYKI
jgi:splicing factor, arginine/serine-rich 16